MICELGDTFSEVMRHDSSTIKISCVNMYCDLILEVWDMIQVIWDMICNLGDMFLVVMKSDSSTVNISCFNMYEKLFLRYWETWFVSWETCF